MKRTLAGVFVFAYACGGILIIVHAPSYALGGGLMMYAAGLVGGILIAAPSDRDGGSAGDPAQTGAPLRSSASPGREAASPNPSPNPPPSAPGETL